MSRKIIAWSSRRMRRPAGVVQVTRWYRALTSNGADSHAPRRAPDRLGWPAAAGKRQEWLLRSLTSLGALVPGRRRGWTEIPSACVSWPEQPSTPGRPAKVGAAEVY